jgi:hypothetical protein
MHVHDAGYRQLCAPEPGAPAQVGALKLPVMESPLRVMWNVPEIMFASEEVTSTVPEPDSPTVEWQEASNSAYCTFNPT